MDRRAVLRLLALGAAGASGCLGDGSGESGPTAAGEASTSAGTESTPAAARDATREPSGPTPTTSNETTADSTTRATTSSEPANSPEPTTGGCPPSILPDGRRHVRDEYGLTLVSPDAGSPARAVAVVGEDWRDTLDADAMTDEDAAFVSATDFDRFVVLAVQYEKSSGGHRLRVTDVAVEDDLVGATICVVARGATQDAPIANLFVRVPYSGSPPARARVRIRRPNEAITVSSE